MSKKSVLLVCFGNICRSPMAEALFVHELQQRGVAGEWHVDSAGTADFNVGMPPYHQAIATLERHGVIVQKRLARQVHDDDFSQFRYMLCMDESNLRDLEQIKPRLSQAEVMLLGNYDPQGRRIIKDPGLSRTHTREQQANLKKSISSASDLSLPS